MKPATIPAVSTFRWSASARSVHRAVRYQKTRNLKTTNCGFPARRSQPSPQSRRHLFMTRELAHHNRPVFDQLHPNVYKAAVGLVALFVLAAWISFDRQNDIGLPLAMVSVLLLVAVLLPWSLSLIWKKYQMPNQQHPDKPSFRD